MCRLFDIDGIEASVSPRGNSASFCEEGQHVAAKLNELVDAVRESEPADLGCLESYGRLPLKDVDDNPQPPPIGIDFGDGGGKVS